MELITQPGFAMSVKEIKNELQSGSKTRVNTEAIPQTAPDLT
jgi:hypothetical protein